MITKTGKMFAVLTTISDGLGSQPGGTVLSLAKVVMAMPAEFHPLFTR